MAIKTLLNFLLAIFRTRDVPIHFRTLPAKDAGSGLVAPPYKMVATINQLEAIPSFSKTLKGEIVVRASTSSSIRAATQMQRSRLSMLCSSRTTI